MLFYKFLLQGLSAIPSLGNLAFGFRPIVIGYLHLVLLGFVTLFLLGYLVQQQWLYAFSKLQVTGMVIFTFGVIINEVLLMIQGIASIDYTSLPLVNYFLLGAAIMLFSGLLLFFTGQFQPHERALP